MHLDRRDATKLMLTMTAATFAGAAQAADTVRLGQATTTLGFLPVWAARTFETFAAQNLALTWSAVSGGDPAALAALDSGDLDLAATGSDAVIDAAGKGLPYQIVYSLMSKISLVLTVSEAFVKRTGVTKDLPVAQRIAALKGATIGVAAIGGAQDRTVRWLAARGGLDAKKDVQIAQIGGAPALGAALENGRIEAFMLSPPEGQLAEAGGYGRILIEPDRDLPGLHGFPSLVVVARSDANAAVQAKIVATLRALNAGSRALLGNLDAGADKMGALFFPKIAQPVMRASIRSLEDGIRDDGLMNEERAKLLVQFTVESGRTPPAAGTRFWTNRYVEAAKAG